MRVALPLNRIFRTFGADKSEVSCYQSSARLSNQPFGLFPKSIQVVDWE
jgi:hypothetical protein